MRVEGPATWRRSSMNSAARMCTPATVPVRLRRDQVSVVPLLVGVGADVGAGAGGGVGWTGTGVTTTVGSTAAGAAAVAGIAAGPVGTAVGTAVAGGRGSSPSS